MTEGERMVSILKGSYQLFAKTGIASTTIDEIAHYLKMSKKTIYSFYKSKDELIQATCQWKMHTIAESVSEVVELDLPIVKKLVKYIEVMSQSLSDVSIRVIQDLILHRELINSFTEEYIKKAVFGRVTKLIEQAKQEDKMNDEVEPGKVLLLYWEMLSGILVTQPVNKLPIEMVSSKSVDCIVGKKIVELFRNLLNDEGAKQFDEELELTTTFNSLNR